MNELKQLSKILFLDIETVPQQYNFNDLDEKTRLLFEAKTRFQRSEEKDFPELYNEKAGILSEFGKIICISVGYIHESERGRQVIMKSFYSDDEKKLLEDFSKILVKTKGFTKDSERMLCGHNSKEFDIPYICRRMLINGLRLPEILNIAGKKPWEIQHIDTMELWKFGDYKAYTSLALLCHVFHIPTPKDDISGADVARVYYEEGDLERIKIYCEKDVVALIQLYLRMQGEPLIEESAIIYRGAGE